MPTLRQKEEHDDTALHLSPHRMVHVEASRKGYTYCGKFVGTNQAALWLTSEDAEVTCKTCQIVAPAQEDELTRLRKVNTNKLAALQGILAEPYGCSLCDSGKLRNPGKGHQPDCPYEVAHAAIAKARAEPT